MGPCLFLLEHLFCLSLRKTHYTMSVDNTSLNMFFGDLELHGRFDHFFLGVNRNGLGTSFTANHRCYKALGRLHGPWCEESLRCVWRKKNIKLWLN